MRLASSHTCVMPTFSPTIAFVAMEQPLRPGAAWADAVDVVVTSPSGAGAHRARSCRRSARQAPGGASDSIQPGGPHRGGGHTRTSVDTDGGPGNPEAACRCYRGAGAVPSARA